MDRRRYRLATACIALAGALVVWLLATELFPYHSLNHDEGVYLQQAAMLLEGQLTLRPPVEDAFRPWFFIADGDRLYPKYAPVPAAMFALGELLGGYRLALVGIAAAILALVVGIVREVFDRPTGLLAGAFVLASPLFLLDSSVFLPYAPTTLLNLLFAYGYLRADRTGDRRWAVLAGAAVGLAFFARPYTAVLFAAPFVVHALWRLPREWPGRVPSQLIVAALGLAGVGLALAYNAVLTGSPLRFPYEAFAPLDGPGFGRRRMLTREIRYTPELAVRANRVALELLFTRWIAGGVVGAALAAVGVVHAVGARRLPRAAVLAGLFGSVSLGNLYFWGNLNILGDLTRPGDGLVSAFGPYYHFDLLLPTAAFAAAGAVWGGRHLSRVLRRRLDRRLAVAGLAVVALAGVGVLGGVTATALEDPIDKNAAATDAYEDAYEPFDDGPPERSLVLLPDPYGDWLNHPFQPLRNEPGFDGPAVYAIDDRPFAVADAFPDRDLYRYAYRGAWAPYAGSPREARLQRVSDVSGSRVRLETTLGIPDGAVGVTVRLGEETRELYTAPSDADSLDLALTIEDGRARLAGDVRPVDPGDETAIALEGRETVELAAFVDYGPRGGFSYRLDLPVALSEGQVRALSPRTERCRAPQFCGGAAAHIPSTAPDGVFVRTEIVTADPNG